jgi:hypothetical protein
MDQTQTITESLDFPFLIEKSKLRRLIEVIENCFHRKSLPITYSLDCYLKSKRVLNFSSVDSIFNSVDNTDYDPVERLKITFSCPNNEIFSLIVEIAGESEAFQIILRSPDSDFSKLLLIEIKEQIYRFDAKIPLISPLVSFLFPTLLPVILIIAILSISIKRENVVNPMTGLNLSVKNSFLERSHLIKTLDAIVRNVFRFLRAGRTFSRLA